MTELRWMLNCQDIHIVNAVMKVKNELDMLNCYSQE